MELPFEWPYSCEEALTCTSVGNPSKCQFYQAGREGKCSFGPSSLSYLGWTEACSCLPRKNHTAKLTPKHDQQNWWWVREKWLLIPCNRYWDMQLRLICVRMGHSSISSPDRTFSPWVWDDAPPCYLVLNATLDRWQDMQPGSSRLRVGYPWG